MARQAPRNFRHSSNRDQLVIPKRVTDAIAELQLRLEDVRQTFNVPLSETRLGEGKYRRMRWFGAYWVGLLCKWSETEGTWVIPAYRKEATFG
jgi:hypothetical protein